MFPDKFIQRVKSQDNVDADSLFAALNEPSPISIRLNINKWNRKPSDNDSVTWCNNGFYLPLRPSFTLDPLFHSGCYYPQEASSMFLLEALTQCVKNRNDIKVLDLCAAPGGKTLLISDFIGGNSFLVSNEVIRQRSVVLSETVTKWGNGNTIVSQNDPASVSRLAGCFDVIVADAPCSGEGMFRTKIARDEWSVENTVLCAERQRRILMDMWPALKEDGLLIYSTCTFNPAENEENVSWFAGKHGAESVKLDVSAFKGITEISFNGIYCYYFFPGKIKGDGFFISVIRKRGIQESSNSRIRKGKDMRPSKEESKKAAEWSGFNPDRLIKWRDEVLALHCDMNDYLPLFQELNIVKPGTILFSVKNNDFLPSHELAVSQFIKNESFPKKELELMESLAYLRRDSFNISTKGTGWKILKYKDVNLGFVKEIGSRFNNYFPVEWRIRMNIGEPDEINKISWNDEE
jgi:16S rRNA C967 or C1407 C5-methylase (RsmB/RsmF family)/NOL1/NOP2/fmu family ribosome biogenesis protein